MVPISPNLKNNKKKFSGSESDDSGFSSMKRYADVSFSTDGLYNQLHTYFGLFSFI